MPNTKTQTAQKQIDAFKQRFTALHGDGRHGSGHHGNGHYVLAMQAAVPVFFSPDLLYRLWQNFRTFQLADEKEQRIPEIAVSDLLLSPLCTASGFEMYEMPAAVRDILLKDLENILGSERLKRVAAFLEAYSQVHYSAQGMENFRSVQRWAALSLLNPNAAVKQVSEALSGAVASNNVGEQLRLAVLLEKLAPNANEFSELLPLGEGIRAHNLGNTAHVVKMPVLRTTPSESGTTLLTMLLPESLRGKVEREQVEKIQINPLEERLQKCHESGGRVLDLSDLELEELPREVFEFTGLENLILSQNPLKQLPKDIGMFAALRDLIVDNCEISDISNALFELKNLEFLDLANNYLLSSLDIQLDGDTTTFIPEFFLGFQDLFNLKELHLENNLLELVPSEIANMRSLEKLSLERNLLKQPPFYIAEQGLDAIRMYFKKGIDAFEQKAAFLSFFPDDTASELVELIPLASQYSIKLWFQEEEEQEIESEENSLWESASEESPSEESASESDQSYTQEIEQTTYESASEETEEAFEIKPVEIRGKANAIVVYLSDAYLNFEQTLQQYMACWQQGYREQHIFLIASREMQKGADLLEEKVRELYLKMSEEINDGKKGALVTKGYKIGDLSDSEKESIASFEAEVIILEELKRRIQKSDYYTLADLQQQRYEPLLRFIAEAPAPVAEAPKDRETQIAEAVKTTRGAMFLKDTNYEPLAESLHLTYHNNYESYLATLPESSTPVAEQLYHGFFDIEGKIARILLGEPLRLLATLPFLEQVQITLPYEGLIRKVNLTKEAAKQYTGTDLTSIAPDTEAWITQIDQPFIHNEAAQRKWMEDQVQYFTEKGNTELVLVRGGTFGMGSEDIENAKPVHDVTLDDFYIGKYTVTNEEYCRFLNSIKPDEKQLEEWIDLNGEFEKERCRIHFDSSKFISEESYERHPVIYVSWFGAKAYCDWAIGSLPTEAQWEYAAKGGKKSKGFVYAGSENIDDVAWYIQNAYYIGQNNPDYGVHKVGEKKPNEIRLYDISGNVWEWCQNWYDKGYFDEIRGSLHFDEWNKNTSKIKNPKGSINGFQRVIRGGSWDDSSNLSRSVNRLGSRPARWINDVGFRSCRRI